MCAYECLCVPMSAYEFEADIILDPGQFSSRANQTQADNLTQVIRVQRGKVMS